MNKYRIIQNGKEIKSTSRPDKVKTYLSMHNLVKENNGVFFLVEGVEVIPPKFTDYPDISNSDVSMCNGCSHI